MAEKNEAVASEKTARKSASDQKEDEVLSTPKFIMLAPEVPGGTFAGSLISFKEGVKYPIEDFEDNFVAALVTRNIVVLVD